LQEAILDLAPLSDILGNIYTDKALHLADLHPIAKSDLIKRKQVQIQQRSVRAVLREGIRQNGTSTDWICRGVDIQNYLQVYGCKLSAECPSKKTLLGNKVHVFVRVSEKDLEEQNNGNELDDHRHSDCCLGCGIFVGIIRIGNKKRL